MNRKKSNCKLELYDCKPCMYYNKCLTILMADTMHNMLIKSDTEDIIWSERNYNWKSVNTKYIRKIYKESENE